MNSFRPLWRVPGVLVDDRRDTRHDGLAPAAHAVRPALNSVPAATGDPRPTDAALIHAARSEPDRFADLYDRHVADLFRYARRRVGPDLAEDVVADAFVVAFRRRGSYDLSQPDARPWLFGILTKEIFRHRRRERAHYRALARLPHDRGHDALADRVVDIVSAAATARGALAAAIAGLATRDRDVLLLVAWGQLNYLEVARTLGIPVGTVRSRLNRARRAVRAAVGEQS